MVDDIVLDFQSITSADTLARAHKNALKGKRLNHFACRLDYRLVSSLMELRNNLIDESYRPLAYRKKTIYEPKERRIEAPAYRDRIVHHALHHHLNSYYEKHFIADSFACRPTKGIHSASLKVQRILRSQSRGLYVCQIDISKYYASINHQKLKKILTRDIKDPKLLRLLSLIIDSTDSGTEHDHLFAPDSYYHTKGRHGIPIGNLTSQLFANIYLHQADMYAKQQLKIRHYVRYMDDILLFHSDKKVLHAYKDALTQFLYDELYLTVNPRKVRVYPARVGVTFVGYVIYPYSMRLKSASVRRFKKKFNKKLAKLATGKISEVDFDASFESWKAHAAHANTKRLVQSLEERRRTAKVHYTQTSLLDDLELF